MRESLRRITAKHRLESAARYFVKGHAGSLDELERAALAYQTVLQLEVTAVDVPLVDIEDGHDIGGEG